MIFCWDEKHDCKTSTKNKQVLINLIKWIKFYKIKNNVFDRFFLRQTFQKLCICTLHAMIDFEWFSLKTFMLISHGIIVHKGFPLMFSSLTLLCIMTQG